LLVSSSLFNESHQVVVTVFFQVDGNHRGLLGELPPCSTSPELTYWVQADPAVKEADWACVILQFELMKMKNISEIKLPNPEDTMEGETLVNTSSLSSYVIFHY
jgi:hypothetical protein